MTNTKKITKRRKGQSASKAMLDRVNVMRPHKLMTRDEYNSMKIFGLHYVCHDWCGEGNTAIWLRSNSVFSGTPSGVSAGKQG